MNLLLVIAAFGLAVHAALRRFSDRHENLLLLLAAVVLGSSVLQALFEATDNARYSIPTQSLVVVFVVALAYHVTQNRPFRRRSVIHSQNESPIVRPAHPNKEQ